MRCSSAATAQIRGARRPQDQARPLRCSSAATAHIVTVHIRFQELWPIQVRCLLAWVQGLCGVDQWTLGTHPGCGLPCRGVRDTPGHTSCMTSCSAASASKCTSVTRVGCMRRPSGRFATVSAVQRQGASAVGLETIEVSLQLPGAAATHSRLSEATPVLIEQTVSYACSGNRFHLCIYMCSVHSGMPFWAELCLADLAVRIHMPQPVRWGKVRGR